MGQFSWLYSDTERQMLDGVTHNSYLLVPPPFQSEYGKYITEPCYEGYGEFDGFDVYELVAEWNKDYFTEEFFNSLKTSTHKDIIATALKLKSGDIKLSELDIQTRRLIGISIACYDEDNERLTWPIKITERPMEYQSALPSKSDPNQGWEIDEGDEDYEW